MEWQVFLRVPPRFQIAALRMDLLGDEVADGPVRFPALVPLRDGGHPG